MMYKTEILEVTSDVRSKPLEKKRKRGRPAQLPLCLVRSPPNRDSSSRDLDTEIVTDDTQLELSPVPSAVYQPLTPAPPSQTVVQTILTSPALPTTPSIPGRRIRSRILTTTSLTSPVLAIRPAKRKGNFQESQTAKKNKKNTDPNFEMGTSRTYNTRSRKK